jgi:myo-inositol-1(or 4)-monophosphatase
MVDIDESLLDDIEPMITTLVTETGQLLRDLRATAVLNPDTKSSANDFVTEADRAAEQKVVASIRSFRPDDGIIGEEGERTNPGARMQWVIDPLDGTTNYIHGSGPFAVSIGVELDGVPVAGAIHTVLSNETFVGIQGRGAYCNGNAISASAKDDLARAIVGFDGSTDSVVRNKQAELVQRLLPEVGDLRRIGSCCTDLCWVAAGRLDGFFNHGAGPWDISAGTVIAREAGAWVGSSAGDFPTTAETIAAGPLLALALRHHIAGF